VLELCPGCHVAFFEDGALARRGGGVDKVLGFGPEGQVGNENVAAFGDKGFDEAEIYSLDFSSVLVWREGFWCAVEKVKKGSLTDRIQHR
jgi:hypothetical protein